jgi:hypothetical protein
MEIGEDHFSQLNDRYQQTHQIVVINVQLKCLGLLPLLVSLPGFRPTDPFSWKFFKEMFKVCRNCVYSTAMSGNSPNSSIHNAREYCQTPSIFTQFRNKTLT